ncbi:methyltransferase domain protein [Streptomyces ipomoeae 91-03]|uniref:Methyltransferase domain protein n=1 Tax=Streptomyces ipomoeae 91-03 TaxID=698759 RepID=L1KS38_9ACTN|nr:methyltransferase domain protein [Streptomyces ipomoeae 91-03]
MTGIGRGAPEKHPLGKNAGVTEQHGTGERDGTREHDDTGGHRDTGEQHGAREHLRTRFDGMALYDPQHVRDALAPLLDRPGPFTPGDLEPYDQMHYLGHRALDNAVARLGAAPGADVVDIGAGLGGPARYLADRYKCRVTAVELQPELHRLSEELTALCGLSDRVRAVRADALTLGGADWAQRYDHLISLLAVLHIPRRAELFAVFRELFRPDGTFHIEDFYARRPLTGAERADLAGLVACPYLPDETRYRDDLTRAGFTDVTWTDATDLWRPWVRDRAEVFRDTYEDRVRLHGEPLAARLLRFYDTISTLFTGGGVGGVRVTGRRRS